MYQATGQKLPGVTGITSTYYGGPFRTLTNGKLLRKSTAFYLGTYYIHVLHADNTVGVYGEIYPGLIPSGDTFSAGQKLGYIKWVGLKSVPPMLHMEHFKGEVAKKLESDRNAWKGNFKVNGRNTKRSNDLIDRTKLLRQLELDSF